MTPAEKKLRKFLNLSDDAQISPVAQQIMTKYLDLPEEDFKRVAEAVPNGLQFLQQQSLIPPQVGSNLINAIRNNPRSHTILSDQLFLFAAGSQIAFDSLAPEEKKSLVDSKTLNTVFEGHVARHIDQQGIKVLYAYADKGDDTSPESVIITLGGAIAYAISHLTAAPAAAPQVVKDRYADQVRLALHAGAEETLHAHQHHDPALAASIERQSIARYGDDWENEREKQWIASRGSPENIIAFSSKDPYEMDADKKMSLLEKRLDVLKDKFLSPRREL